MNCKRVQEGMLNNLHLNFISTFTYFKKIHLYSQIFFSGMTVYTEKDGDSGGTKFIGSLANAIIIVGVICVVTVVMVLLYKYKYVTIICIFISYPAYKVHA